MFCLMIKIEEVLIIYDLFCIHLPSRYGYRLSAYCEAFFDNAEEVLRTQQCSSYYCLAKDFISNPRVVAS